MNQTTPPTDLLTPAERALADEVNASLRAAAQLSAILNPETMFSRPAVVEERTTGPTPGDVELTAGEWIALLGLRAAQARKRNLPELAKEADDLAWFIGEQEDAIERLSKRATQLAAEKCQAQDWIANLRQTNELYSARIAEQNARLAELEGGK